MVSMSSLRYNLHSPFVRCTPCIVRATVHVFPLLRLRMYMNVLAQGEEDDDFYVVRRGKVELLMDEEVIKEGIGTGQGIGEVGLLFATRRNITARCCGPVEMIVLDRASYQTALSMLPQDERSGPLEEILQQFWELVSRAGPNHVATTELGFQVYRKLNIRTSRSLMMAEDEGEIDEDAERKQSGADWTEDW